MYIKSICSCDAQEYYECGGVESNCEYLKDVHVAQVALCAGRHEIPQAVDGCIFETVADPTDVMGMYYHAVEYFCKNGVEYVDIYVTGLTTALIATLNAAAVRDIKVTLMHYDRATGEYFPQEVMS